MNKAAMQEILGIKWEIRRVFGTHDQVQIALVHDGKDIESMKCTCDHLGTLHPAIDNFIQNEHDPFFNVTENDIFRSKYLSARMMYPEKFKEIDKLINEQWEG